MFGSALHTLEMRTRTALAQHDPQLVADAITYGRQLLATGQFPRLAALYHQQSTPDRITLDGTSTSPPTATDSVEAQFESGLTALLDGLSARSTSDEGTHRT